MAGVFGTIDSYLDDNLDGFISVINTAISSDLAILLTTSLTMYMVFYGYVVLAGKVQAPVEELLWNLAKFALLITFMNNTGGWLDLTKDAIKALSSIGGGDTGLAFIDGQFSRVSQLASKISNNADWGAGWAVSLLIWFGFLLSVLPAGLILVINKITMFFLLAFLPLFIFCLMWGWLKESFNQYMSALLSNAFVIVVITTMLKSIVSFFESFNPSTGNAFLMGMSFLMLGLFGAALMKYIADTCNNIMRVSIEKLPTFKSGERASYSGDGAESKKAKTGRYAKNAAVTLYNRMKF